jgi:alcohol dehydrogenase
MESKVLNRQVWKTDKAGAISRLTLREEPLAPLNPSMVRVEVKAVGLNFADIFALTGLYSATPHGAFIPGLEFSGVVVQSNDQQYKVGDRVMGVTRFGGYASVIDTLPDYLQVIPADWSYEQGAAYLVQTLTAYYALTTLGSLKSNQNVLIHSAAGGVGLQAIKLAQALGANPIGTVRSDEKKAWLQEQGFDQVIVRQPDFDKQLQREGLGFDLILDGVGGQVQKDSFKHLNPMGRLVVFGAAEFTPGKNRPNYLSALFKYLRRPKYDVMDMISDNRSVMAFNLIWLWDQVPTMVELINTMRAIEISPPHVGHTYSFEEAHEAIECLRGGNSQGKVVLTR